MIDRVKVGRYVENLKVKSWAEYYGDDITSLRMFLGNFYSTELFEEIIRFSPKTVLEIGSGTGVMSILLSHLGYDVTSVDSDKGVFEKAKKNNKHYNGNAKFELGDAFNLKYKDKSFDVSFSQGLLEHFSVSDIKKMLEEQMRITKKALVVSMPNNYYAYRDVGNEKLYSREKWESLFRKLTEKKTSSFDYQYLLRWDRPFRTVWNLLRNKKVLTVVTIYMND